MTDTSNPLPSTAPSSPGGPAAAPAMAGGLSIEQHHQMAADAIEKGGLSREQVNAGLVADGLAPLPDANAPPAAGLAPDAAAIDAAFPVPTSIAEYVIPKLTKGDEPLTAAHIEFDRNARGWLMEARLPKELGSSIADAVATTDAQWVRMNDVDRELYVRNERVIVDRVLGPNAQARINLAKQLVRELEQRKPGVVALLEETGAGNSSTVITQLVLHAERLAARRA